MQHAGQGKGAAQLVGISTLPPPQLPLLLRCSGHLDGAPAGGLPVLLLGNADLQHLQLLAVVGSSSIHFEVSWLCTSGGGPHSGSSQAWATDRPEQLPFPAQVTNSPFLHLTPSSYLACSSPLMSALHVMDGLAACAGVGGVRDVQIWQACAAGLASPLLFFLRTLPMNPPSTSTQQKQASSLIRHPQVAVAEGCHLQAREAALPTVSSGPHDQGLPVLQWFSCAWSHTH